MDNQTIEILVEESGATAGIKMDFNLYVGSYQNTLINVVIPRTILLDEVSSEETSTSNVVRIGGISLTESGKTITTKKYNLDFVKTFEVNGKEFSLYQRKLPKEFCLYPGNTTLITNVVNMLTDANGVRISKVITSQTCILPVMESAYLEEEEIIEPADLDIIYGELNKLKKNYGYKVDRIDILEVDNRSDIIFTQDGYKTPYIFYYNFLNFDKGTIGTLFVTEYLAEIEGTIIGRTQCELFYTANILLTRTLDFSTSDEGKTWELVSYTSWQTINNSEIKDVKDEILRLEANLTSHLNNEVIHVTASDKVAWNNKVSRSELEDYATKEYVTNSINNIELPDHYKGQLNNISELPSSSLNNGDFYYVLNLGSEYQKRAGNATWNGNTSSWDIADDKVLQPDNKNIGLNEFGQIEVKNGSITADKLSETYATETYVNDLVGDINAVLATLVEV